MKLYNRYDSVDEPALFTFWSFMHILAGIILYVLCMVLLRTMHVLDSALYAILFASLIHLVYELKDYYMSYISEKRLKHAESNSWINSIVDQLCATLGMLIAWQIFGEDLSAKDVFYVSISYITTYLVVKTINYERDATKENGS